MTTFLSPPGSALPPFVRFGVSFLVTWVERGLDRVQRGGGVAACFPPPCFSQLLSCASPLCSWIKKKGIVPGDIVVGSKWGYTYTADWKVDPGKKPSSPYP